MFNFIIILISYIKLIMFTLKPKELPMMGLDLIFEPQAPWIINEAHGELKHTDR